MVPRGLYKDGWLRSIFAEGAHMVFKPVMREDGSGELA
jgi:hypothetical protein